MELLLIALSVMLLIFLISLLYYGFVDKPEIAEPVIERSPLDVVASSADIKEPLLLRSSKR